MEQFKLLSSRRALTEGMETNHQLVEEVFLLALFLVSTAGNSLSLLVFCRRPGLRTISNRFVINLLATNLVTTSLLAPALFGEHTAREKEGWIEAGDAAAAAYSLAALLAVMLISVDQHHAVTDPLRCHTRLLQRRPAALCAATWLIAALAASSRATIAVVRHYYPLPAVQTAELAYYIVYLIAGILTPVAIVCIMYARIYRAARSSGLRARAQGASALQLHEPHINLPDVIEEGEGLTLKIDMPEDVVEAERKFGPFLLPPERPLRCPSIASLRNSRKEGKSNEDLRKGLPAVNSAPSLAVPLLAVQTCTPAPSNNGSRITSIRCRISNASLFRYREESRAARVGLLTGALVMLHVPHAAVAVVSAVAPGLASCGRTPALVLLLLASAVSPFLFALRSRRVQREARRLLLPEKSAWERTSASTAAADGQRARAALELLRTLTPTSERRESGETRTSVSGNGSEGACRSSFSSGGSTQLSSASDE
ncbi:5-hydroxytryptamine receptor 1A-alpha [Pieris napi]|uniref:5-hydroxytryptamine receptor 1A-alpha n=1 Tax=Pieris napi TaxID=78633 RepID=UPI001FBBFBC8|nr:5-hydroxytryptamine receptor 1A-alpha [Pieris napi]